MELKTSVIRHPSNSPFIMRRQYQVEACEDETVSDKDSTAETCAEILSIMEYHTNNKYKHETLNTLTRKARAKHGKALKDSGDWLPYSYSYLRALLFYSRGQNQIIKALARLEKLNFISSNCPKEISSFYSENQKWYALNIEALNALADMVESGEKVSGGFVPAEPKKVRLNSVTALIESLCQFHRHISGISDMYIYDAKRVKMVRLRFNEYKKNLGDERATAICALAIISNSQDEWYQGNNDKNTTYNWIEHIFGASTKVSNNLRNADKLGLTEEMALSEFQTFLDGGTSRYSKQAEKQAKRDAIAEKQARKIPVDVAKYREFARIVASSFIEGKTAPEMLETCLMDDYLSNAGSELTDGGFLEEQIIEASSIFDDNLSSKVLTEIKQFALDFASNNLANLEE